MAFMLGVRIVSYGVVGAAAILTHETTKVYKEKIYHWVRGKFKSYGSPPQAGGNTDHNPCDAQNQPTYQHSLDGGAHLSSPQIQQQQQLTTPCKDDDPLLSIPQLHQHQQPTTAREDDDAHPTVLLQPQQLTASEKEDDVHLSLKLQKQQLTTADKEDDALLQQQLITAAAAASGGNNHLAHLLVQQQHQQFTAIGQVNDVYDQNHDHAMKTSPLIDVDFELKASSKTNKVHDEVKIEGGAKQEQQAPRLPERGATFFAKVFNAAKSQLHGFFCWAPGLFEDKRWSTVRPVIAKIVRKIFFLLADDLFLSIFKTRNRGLRQFCIVIYNEVKKAYF